MKGIFFAIGIAVYLAPLALLADSSSAHYQMLQPVIAPGSIMTSSDFSLLGIIGQITTGLSSSASFNNNPGFASYPFASTPALSTTPGDSQVSLSWTASSGFLGWNPASYSYGVSSVSGGSYAFTNAGSALSATVSSLTNGTTYYFIVKVLDTFGNTIATSSEVAATPSSGSSGAGGTGGGGGGGGGAAPTTSGASVTFSGRAFPNSSVVLLKDGQIALTTVAGGDAIFTLSLTGLTPGSYVFSVYGTDLKNMKSAPLSFPITLMAGAGTVIGGLFIAPTIGADKSEVRQGDNITFFGHAAASSTVVIGVHSNAAQYVTAPADKDGAYLYVFDTSPLDLGGHLAQSKATLPDQGLASVFGGAVNFLVSTVNKQTQGTLIGDINGDGRVNLIDFSIMAYWYQRPSPPKNVDLDGDGVIDLRDFSILASHWTG